ncbi:MAG: orotidine-5'-phosphate decarboxylase [Fusobacteriales bacterium]|jgi:orotidine-5'-phosphate decarboxylase|nr:orotidine-5'-phosphate decarboxylase [Fusobacteriales bacterium]
MKARKKVITALDYKNMDDVKNLVELLGDEIEYYKAGLEIFLNTGGEIVDYLHSLNKKIFLDLKFHDINNTAKMACEFAARKGVFIFNIHAACGTETMYEISKMLKDMDSKSLCIAVTVLTSMTEEKMRETFMTDVSLDNMVMNMAELTGKRGLHGVVCSAWEAAKVKERCGENFVTVCPGVRPAWSASDDQKRIMTPAEAVKNGADYLVIGRPITKADDPKKAAIRILEEIEAVL